MGALRWWRRRRRRVRPDIARMIIATTLDGQTRSMTIYNTRHLP